MVLQQAHLHQAHPRRREIHILASNTTNRMAAVGTHLPKDPRKFLFLFCHICAIQLTWVALFSSQGYGRPPGQSFSESHSSLPNLNLTFDRRVTCCSRPPTPSAVSATILWTSGSGGRSVPAILPVLPVHWQEESFMCTYRPPVIVEIADQCGCWNHRSASTISARVRNWEDVSMMSTIFNIS